MSSPSEESFVDKVADPKKPYKAIVSMVISACAYLVGVVPAEGGFGDLNTAQWLGLVGFVAAGFGITYYTKNPLVTTSSAGTS